MVINKKMLEEITLGTISIEENDGIYSFLRLSKNQLELLTQRGYALRAYCTASVKLEFYTRGGEISFNYYISKGTNREYYSVDLFEDGVYKYNVSKETFEDSGVFKYFVSSSDKEKKITIYFPTTSKIQISDINLPEDIKPHFRTKTILALGDSMLQGYYPNHSSNSYANIISDYYNANMINQSIGGDVFYKDNIEKTDFVPDMIIVSYGINDWASGRFKNGEDAKEYFEKLKDVFPDVPVAVIIPPEILKFKDNYHNDDMIIQEENKKEQTIEEVRKIISKLIAYYDNFYEINSKDFIPQYRECFYKDDVHLTDMGNTIMATKLIDEINKEIWGC